MAVDKNGRPDFAALFTAAPALVQFWAFDLLEVDGRVLAMFPLLERRRQLTHVFESPPRDTCFPRPLRTPRRCLALRIGSDWRESSQSERYGLPLRQEFPLDQGQDQRMA